MTSRTMKFFENLSIFEIESILKNSKNYFFLKLFGQFELFQKFRDELF